MLQLWQSTRYLDIFDHPKLGPALFLGISAIDHSCAPNAVYISHGKNLIVRTIADKIENFSDIRLCYYRDLRYGNTDCWVFKQGEEYKNAGCKNEKDFLTFFDKINFLITLLLKWCPIFDGSPLHQFSKFKNFLWVCWFLC